MDHDSQTTRTAILAALALMTAACKPDGLSAASPTDCRSLDRNPVLFVHGSGLDSGSFEAMIEAFAREGYAQDYLYAMDMTPPDGDTVRAARTFVADGADRLLDDSRRAFLAAGCKGDAPAKVDIVAHSMGAFSARWYARFIGPGKVRILVTLAGANHGTDALCGRRGTGDRQMCPAFSDVADAGNVQAALNGTPSAPADETPWGRGVDRPGVESLPADAGRSIVYLSVRLDPDRWIVPADSANLDGAGGIRLDRLIDYSLRETSPGNFVYEGATGHDGLPSRPDLIRFVLDVLALR